MPTRMPPTGTNEVAHEQSLVNKKRLFEIVKNYEIRQLQLKENDDGSYDISFTTMSRSQQDGMNAAQQSVQNGGPAGPGAPGAEPLPVPPPEVEKAPAAAATKVVVKVAMEEEAEESPEKIREQLEQKYPKQFLRNMGLA